jgi:hypothetical protein
MLSACTDACHLASTARTLIVDSATNDLSSRPANAVLPSVLGAERLMQLGFHQRVCARVLRALVSNA